MQVIVADVVTTKKILEKYSFNVHEQQLFLFANIFMITGGESKSKINRKRIVINSKRQQIEGEH